MIAAENYIDAVINKAMNIPPARFLSCRCYRYNRTSMMLRLHFDDGSHSESVFDWQHSFAPSLLSAIEVIVTQSLMGTLTAMRMVDSDSFHKSPHLTTVKG